MIWGQLNARSQLLCCQVSRLWSFSICPGTSVSLSSCLDLNLRKYCPRLWLKLPISCSLPVSMVYFVHNILARGWTTTFHSMSIGGRCSRSFKRFLSTEKSQHIGRIGERLAFPGNLCILVSCKSCTRDYMLACTTKEKALYSRRTRLCMTGRLHYLPFSAASI